MNAIAALIEPLEARFSGELSLAYYNFADSSSFLHNATRSMRSASLIKIPLLIQTLSEVAKGKLSLDQRFLLKDTDQVGGAGILHALQAGLTLSLQDLLTLMIIVSDNTATNMIIDSLGETRVNAFLQYLGLSQTQLVGKLQLPVAKQNALQRSGQFNRSCAADILGLLLRLEQRDLLPDDLSELALAILKKQQFTEALSRYLPRDQELDPKPLIVASKSGCLRGLWHDAALVYNSDSQPLYALVIMTDNALDKSYSMEQEGMMLIAKISKEIFALHSRD